MPVLGRIEWSDAVCRFAKAVAHAEGFGVEGAIPTRANNPGDLTGADAGSFETNGKLGEGIWVFRDVRDGWDALCVKIDRIFRGKSVIYPLTMALDAFGRRYSGGDENWAVNAASFLGVPVETTLQQLAE